MRTRFVAKFQAGRTQKNDSITLCYGSGETAQQRSFYFYRVGDPNTSLVDLADTNAEKIRKRVVERASRLQSLLATEAARFGPTERTICNSSFFTDMSPWFTTKLKDLICLTQVSELIREDRPELLRYHGRDLLIADALKGICREHDVEFESNEFGVEPKPTTHKDVKSSQRLVALLHLLRELTIRHRLPDQNQELRSGSPTVGLAAPLAHLDWKSLTSGRFQSNYWGRLPEVIRQSGATVIFVHHLSPALSWRTRRSAIKGISRSMRLRDSAVHVLSHEPLTVAQATAAWRAWRRARPSINRLLVEVDQVLDKSGPDWFWRFTRADVARSLLGHVSLLGLTIDLALNSAGKRFENVNHWIVLSENQRWEHQFALARRREGRARIFAFVHVPVRRWDFRYFLLAQRLSPSGLQSSPVFDSLLVCSPSDFNLLGSYFNDEQEIHPVEALRFTKDFYSSRSEDMSLEGIDLIALGDYDRTETEIVVAAAEKVAGRLRQVNSVSFQAHPLCSKRDKDLGRGLTRRYNSKRTTPASRSLVVASSRTSAWYSYSLAGNPVLIALGTCQLNFCPLTSHPGLIFYTDASAERTHEQLANIGDLVVDNSEDLLYLSALLPRWRSILGLMSETN